MSKFLPLKWLPPRLPAIAALISGALLSMAFPPLSLWPLSFVALVPVTIALYRRPATARTFYKTGSLFGFAYFFAHLWWITDLIPASTITLPWLLTPGIALFAIYLSLFTGLFFLVLRLVTGGSRLAALVAAPGIWVLCERLRASGEFGFPWGSIAYSLARVPVLTQGASIVGVFGLGALIVLVNTAWSFGFLSRTRPRRLLCFAVGVSMFTALVLYGRSCLDRFPDGPPSGGVRIAIVQPNVDLALKWKPEFTDSTFRLIERLSRNASSLGADLVVFPETCAPVYLKYNDIYRERVVSLVKEIDADLFIGFLDGRYDAPDGKLNVYNSSAVFRPDGSFGQYDKTHLLPFGEAMPFSRTFPMLKKINFGQANFAWGTNAEPLASSAGALGPLICFESIFPSLSRRSVRNGANLLINITNDGWFGNTTVPSQHGEMAIFRAVENRRYLLRSANTGVSMLVDPAGRVVNSIDIGQEGLMVENIRPAQTISFYSRFGDFPVLLAAVLLAGVGGLIGALTRRGS